MRGKMNKTHFSDEKQVEMLNEQYSDIFLNGNGGKWKWGENGSGVFLFPENR